jgi:hypothetical protein
MQPNLLDKPMMKRPRQFWILTAVLSLLASNTALAQTDVQPDARLRARVGEYWNAVVASDWATTFRMEKRPQAQEAPLDPMKYYEKKHAEKRFSVARIDKIEQEGDRATAKVSGSQLLSLAGAVFNLPRFIESRWERVDGDWYHVEWTYYTPPEILKVQQEAAAAAAAEAAREAAPPESALPPEQAPPAEAQGR